MQAVGLLQNRFTIDGNEAHELVVVVTGALADPSLAERDEMVHRDDERVVVRWRSPNATEPPLMPVGIERYVAATPN